MSSHHASLFRAWRSSRDITASFALAQASHLAQTLPLACPSVAESAKTTSAKARVWN